MSSKGKKPAKSAIDEVVAREYTIHMHKRVRQPVRDIEDNTRRTNSQNCLGEMEKISANRLE